jgi:hypothetical protein
MAAGGATRTSDERQRGTDTSGPAACVGTIRPRLESLELDSRSPWLQMTILSAAAESQTRRAGVLGGGEFLSNGHERALSNVAEELAASDTFNYKPRCVAVVVVEAAVVWSCTDKVAHAGRAARYEARRVS